jgi:hypothetical protein
VKRLSKMTFFYFKCLCLGLVSFALIHYDWLNMQNYFHYESLFIQLKLSFKVILGSIWFILFGHLTERLLEFSKLGCWNKHQLDFIIYINNFDFSKKIELLWRYKNKVFLAYKIIRIFSKFTKEKSIKEILT